MKRLGCIIGSLFIMAGCGSERTSLGVETVGVDTATKYPPTSDRSKVHPRRSNTGEAAAADTRVIPRLLYFTRDHCLPCEIMAPWFEAIRRAHGSALDVKEVNLDRTENRAIGHTLNVRTVPTQVYFGSGGRELHRHQGLATQKEMVGILCDLNLITCSPR